MLRIVPYYAALLALLYFVLAIRVIRVRRRERIAVGTGRNAMLERRTRVHANFAEYAPFILLLLAMAELRGARSILLHVLRLVLVAGRVAHAWGMSREPDQLTLRTVGMVATLLALLGSAVLIAAT